MAKLFANIDTNDYGDRFLNDLTDKKKDIKKEDLYPFVDQYAGKSVTDLLICLTCQYSIPESKVLSDSVFKYEEEIENGIPVNYKEYFRGSYKMYKEYGIDPIKVWLERCREVNLTPWASLRMNDCHCPDDETCFLRPALFYEAREKGWMIGEKYGYFRYCLDYSVYEIRKMWLDYIDEQLYKYDVDGLELDFQREIHCFDYINQPECYKIMNDFIREVKKIITKHEEIKGHKIKLGVRLNRDIEQNKVFGFDAVTWDNEKLVDMIVITPRWETNDSDMPVKAWKETLKNTEIYAGIETLIKSYSSRGHATADSIRGYANRYLSEGADAIYLFNYYPLPDSDLEGEKIRKARSMDIFATCGNLDDVRSKPMRFIVTGQDIAPEGYNVYKPLPILLNGEKQNIKVNIGKLPAEKKVKLFIGIEAADASETEVKVFENKLNLSRENPKPSDMQENLTEGEIVCGCGYISNGTLTYSATVETLTSGEYEINFSGNKGKITYIEFYIE